MLVDRPKRFLAGGEGHISDRAEHDDAHDHRQRLEPQQAVTAQHAEIQAAGQRSAAERDGAGNPARTGKAKVDAIATDWAFCLGLGQKLPFLLNLIVGVGHVCCVLAVKRANRIGARCRTGLYRGARRFSRRGHWPRLYRRRKWGGVTAPSPPNTARHRARRRSRCRPR